MSAVTRAFWRCHLKVLTQIRETLTINRELNWGRAVIQDLLRKAQPYSSVLDIGAGRGSDLLAAKLIEPQASLHALECYGPSIEHLKSSGIATYAVNIERECIPLPGESIDVILSNQTFEHLKEVFWTLHEASRVLKVGGRLIIGVPNLASLHNRLLLLAGRQPTSIQNNSAHLRGYTRRDFVNLLSCFSSGYRLLSWRGSNFYPLPEALARPASRLFPSLAWATFMLFQKQRAYNREFLEYPVTKSLETNFYLGSDS